MAEAILGADRSGIQEVFYKIGFAEKLIIL